MTWKAEFGMTLLSGRRPFTRYYPQFEDEKINLKDIFWVSLQQGLIAATFALAFTGFLLSIKSLFL